MWGEKCVFVKFIIDIIFDCFFYNILWILFLDFCKSDFFLFDNVIGIYYIEYILFNL